MKESVGTKGIGGSYSKASLFQILDKLGKSGVKEEIENIPSDESFADESDDWDDAANYINSVFKRFRVPLLVTGFKHAPTAEDDSSYMVWLKPIKGTNIAENKTKMKEQKDIKKDNEKEEVVEEGTNLDIAKYGKKRAIEAKEMTKEQRVSQIKKLAERIQKLSGKKLVFQEHPKKDAKPKMDEATRAKKLEEIKKLVKLIEAKTGKKVVFKEAKMIFNEEPVAVKKMTESEYKKKLNKMQEMHDTQTVNSPGRTQMKKEMAELKNKYSKQLKEAEAEKAKAKKK